MKLYKFRSLANDVDFERAVRILETGEFHCSSFSELNDPVEGGFTIFPKEGDLEDGVISAIYGMKKKYKICSFSGSEAFAEPVMWGYYANGFRGIAIEIETNKGEVEEIKYADEISHVENGQDLEGTTRGILTTKLKPWRREYEYRFLTQSEEDKQKIGTIKALYFGHPYERALNQKKIYKNSPALESYEHWKKELINAAGTVNCYEVSIINNHVQKGKLITLAEAAIEE